MKPALAQVCSLHSSFEKDIEDYAAGACHAVELWFGKLESYLDKHSVADVRQLMATHEMVAPVASFQGGLFARDDAARAEHWASFEQRLTLCRELRIGTIVVAGDLAGPFDAGDFERLRASLVDLARSAEKQAMRVALEFQGRAPFMNNLQTAASLVADVANPSLGLCLDLFHYYVGPSKPEDFGHLTSQNLFHVQLCDLAGHARELATDGDRILPGDGDFLIEPLVARLREIGYDGYISVELMNPGLWRIPARQFGEIAMTAIRKVLGQAKMG